MIARTEYLNRLITWREKKLIKVVTGARRCGKSTLYEQFEANHTEGITYYQVSASVLDEATLTRVLEPLKKISDHYPKMLLTLDEIGTGTYYDGIKHMNL